MIHKIIEKFGNLTVYDLYIIFSRLSDYLTEPYLLWILEKIKSERIARR